MDRKVPFEIGEMYHLYTRGVEKRIIFMQESDKKRFILLLLLCNGENSIRLADFIKISQGEPLRKACEVREKSTPLVDILAYVLMPNHIHLMVRERTEKGVSKFMLKLMTAYAMFFNTKYERSGPLFTRPFRSRHIDTDGYACWVFAYIHTNQIALKQSDWKRAGIQNLAETARYLQNYAYSSYPDYFGNQRVESRILSKEALPFELDALKNIDDLLTLLSTNTPESLL